MKKYIILYRAPADLMAESMKDTTPEQMKENMKAWHAWAESCGDSLVDLGTPLGNGFAFSKEGSKDGSNDVVGYSVLQAEDKESVEKLLENHPHIAWSGSCNIEVNESLPMPG